MGSARSSSTNDLLRLCCYAPISALLVVSFVSSRQALAESDDSEVVDEIVVTALKRGEQRLLDAAAGVSVIDGQFIDDLNADTLSDFLSTIPATSIDSAGAGENNIQIRGVNTTFGAASVGFYLDGLPFSYISFNKLPDPNPYDLDSIEILRGPQGTLYGAGSSGGVVLVQTNDPELDEFQGKIRLTGSNTTHGEDNYGIAGALNIPLIDDRLAIRATASVQNNSGWIDGTINGQQNINDEDRQNYRIKVRATPTDKLELMFLANITRIDAGMDIISDNSREYPDYLDMTRTIESDHYGVVLSYDTPWFNLVNTTSHNDHTSFNRFVVNAVIEAPTFSSLETTANELRLTSPGNKNFGWVAGVFYRDAEEFFTQEIPSIPGTLFADTQKSEQVSVYATGGFSFWDELAELSLGLSYFEDEVSNQGLLDGEISDPRSGNFDLWSSKITLALYPGKTNTVYLTLAEGFRSGLPVAAPIYDLVQQLIPTYSGIVDPELHRSFEIGAKGELRDGRVYTELVLFYTNIEDIQQSGAVVVPGTGSSFNTIINAGDATSRGVEFVVGAELLDGLNLNLSGSYIKAEIDGDFFAPGSDPTTDEPIYVDGTRLNLVPEVILSGSLSYGWTMGKSNLDALAFASVQHTSDRELSLLLAPPIVGSDITRVDVRFEIGRDNWTVFLFGENLLNDFGVISPHLNQTLFDAFDEPYDGALGTRLRPRTIGAGFRIAF